jgi:chromosome segregation ATPase
MDMRTGMCMDTEDNGRWMTYAELGLVRGISKESALKLALRRKWRKQPDNQGQVRVYVPLDWAGSRDKRAAPGAEARADISMDVSTVIKPLEAAIAALQEQLAALRADQERERASWTERLTGLRADLERERQRADRAEKRAEEADTRADKAEARAEAEQERAEAAGVQVEQLKRILREAETGLTAERAGKATAEAALAAQTKAEAKAMEAERATQAAEAEAAQLRQAAEQAVREAEALRAEVTRVTAQAAAEEATDRPAMVASRIDEVQLRRLQEAEQARKSLGRLTRLRLAWRGE